MGGGMGGGSGKQTSTNTAEYPAEFRPIAKGAANQILNTQQQLPLASFAQPNPGQTAGIAPFQQATMNMAPGLLAPSWGLETLQNLGQPIGTLANNSIGIGNQNSPFANALTALQAGGFGTTGLGASPMPPMQQQNPFQLQTPGMTNVAPQSNVVGGSPDLVAQLMSQLSGQVPSTTPTLNAPPQPFNAYNSMPNMLGRS